MAKENEQKYPAVTPKDDVESKRRELEEQVAETKHTFTLAGEEIAYTAKAGTLILKDDEGNPKASIFYVAYTRDGVEDVSQRPITFSFNGGPGSSSVWLHLGVLGPQRVLMDHEGNPLPPPFKLVNNEYSLLDVTDLVFIDPVSTGYSRPAPGEEAKQFHGVEQDIASVAEFIRLFTARAQRWTSPKFLIGESYGTTRAAGLSSYLHEELGMYINGIMLVSAILNFQSARFSLGNDLPYILFLPTYAATAWYHKRLPEDLQTLSLVDFLSRVEAFAIGTYTTALMKGADLPVEERTEVAATLARYTGLTQTYVEQTNLRINIHRFVKEFLREERRTIGRFDSRVKGIDRDAAGEHHDYDPSYATVQGAYTAAWSLRSLGARFPQERSGLRDSDRQRTALGLQQIPEPVRERGWREPATGDDLRSRIRFSSATATTIWRRRTSRRNTPSTTWSLTTLEGHVTMGYYEAGHEMYLHEPSLQKLKRT